MPETTDSQVPLWLQALGSVVFILFCLELGFFLITYPWFGNLWTSNRLFQLLPDLQPFLLSRHVRGAVSGLGILNLLIALYEIFRLRRFWRG
jgi:hypothetical protein